MKQPPPEDSRDPVGPASRDEFEKLLNSGWLQAVADSAPVAVMAVDTEGRMTFWNRAAEEIFGWRADEVLGRPNPIVPAAKGPEFRTALEETISGRPLRGVELERRRKDGSPVWIRLSNIVLRDAAGAPVGVLGIIEDVSHERNLADRTRQLLATTLDGYILADTAGRIREVNPAYCRMVGYSGEELVGTTILEREAALDAVALEELIPTMVAAGSARFETRHRRKDGAEIDLDVSITILDVPDGPLVAAFVRDITAERRLRRELEASRANLQLIYDTAGDMLFQLAVEGDDRYRFVSVNRKFLEATGLTEDQVVGKLTPEVIPEPSHSLVLARYSEAIRNRSTVAWDDETPYPSGLKVGSVTVAPAFDAEGRCTHLVGSVHDLAERVEAERALRESEEKLRLFIDQAPVALAMFDGEMRYLAASRGWVTDSRLESVEVVGRCHYDLFPTLPQGWKEAHRRGLAGEVSHAEGDRFEWPDGTEQWIDWEVRPWYDAAGAVGGIIIFTRDVTEKKAGADALRRLNEELEERVAERTSELRRAVDMMTGREIRMAELKRVIRTLRRQIEEEGIEPAADDPLSGAGR